MSATTCKKCNRPAKTDYVRSECANGAWQIWSRCRSCLGNFRGPGVWVSREFLYKQHIDPDRLPIVARTQDPAVRSLMLFGNDDQEAA